MLTLSDFLLVEVPELVIELLLLKDSQAYGPFVVTSGQRCSPFPISANIACIYPPDACTLVQREQSRKLTARGWPMDQNI